MKPVTPLLTVDAIIVYNSDIVFVRRKNDPFKGMFALPGGFVELGETTEQAVVREALEETGLSIEIVKLLGVYSESSRDPRGHTVSICYLAKGTGIPKAGSDAAEVALLTIDCIPKLAFDHNHIIEQARVDINGVLSKM